MKFKFKIYLLKRTKYKFDLGVLNFLSYYPFSFGGVSLVLLITISLYIYKIRPKSSGKYD